MQHHGKSMVTVWARKGKLRLPKPYEEEKGDVQARLKRS
jgi:hypothetical protein